MPNWNCNRRQQEGVRQAVAARRHHVVKNKWIVSQTNKNGELNTEPACDATAQKVANTNVKSRAQECGMPDRRRVRLAAVRLRRAARGLDGGDRRRGPGRRRVPARARGPGDRPA